jgi:diphosphomevalonate decarboxylase
MVNDFMEAHQATARAHPNIALIKYWGNLDHELRLPANSSLSMTLGDLETRTMVRFDDRLDADQILIDDVPALETASRRVRQHLDRIRRIAGIDTYAFVESKNTFPSGAGIASSASAFAALTLAAATACDLYLDVRALSRLARQGSGSASRSMFGGFVIWHAGDSDSESYAETIAGKEHWPLIDLIAVVDTDHKSTGSTEGHRLAETSPLQEARVTDTPRRLAICRQAIERRDFSALATIVEQDSNMMHAVMMTSEPALLYWSPATIEIMKTVARLRSEGLDVCYSIDAGPNVHCICTPGHANAVLETLRKAPGIRNVLKSLPGDGAEIIDS